MQVDYEPLFTAYENILAAKRQRAQESTAPRNALEAFLHSTQEVKSGSGFQRMERCR